MHNRLYLQRFDGEVRRGILSHDAIELLKKIDLNVFTEAG